jgi:hypothetical protein
MNKRFHERAIFSAFLTAAPSFADESVVVWRQPDDERDFPDIISTATSGALIGVELGEWLNQKEMTAAKGLERLHHSVLQAIGEQGPNRTENILFVWLHPKPKARIRPADSAAFRSELFSCIWNCDGRWSSERYWQSPQGARVAGADLTAYPTLGRYLNGIRMFPRARYHGWPPDGAIEKEQWAEGIDWITFPARGGPFSEDTMLQPLLQLLSDKTEHYAGEGTGFSRLYLVVYYNQAVLYNSPAETPRFGFEDAVVRACEFLEGDPDPFDAIFLFIAVDGGRVFTIC